MKSTCLFWLRGLVGVGVILMVLYAVDFKEFPRVSEIKIGYLLFAAFLVLSERVISAWKWHLLIVSQDMDISFKDLLNIYFKSLFVGLVIPSSAGGELLKGYSLVRFGSTVIDSFSSVVMERTLGLVALTSICLSSFGLFWDSIEGIATVVSVRNVAIMCFLVSVLVIAGGCVLYPGKTWLARATAKNMSVWRQQIWAAFWYYRNVKAKLYVAVVLSFLVQFNRILFVYFVGMSVGITLGLPYYFVFVPVVVLASVIPLSVAGVGFQEGAFVYLFGLSGTSPAQILGMALLVRLLTIVSVLPGGFFYLKEGLSPMPGKTVSQK